jgi:antitoxin FitA
LLPFDDSICYRSGFELPTWGAAVATLLVRKLEPELVELLKRQAASHGRSVEAEHRAILRAALQPKLDDKELFEMLREGETWPGDIEPDGWRRDDRGEPADI